MEVKKYDDELNEEDFDENGVDVLSGSCRRVFTFDKNFRVFLQPLQRLDKALRACIELLELQHTTVSLIRSKTMGKMIKLLLVINFSFQLAEGKRNKTFLSNLFTLFFDPSTKVPREMT